MLFKLLGIILIIWFPTFDMTITYVIDLCFENVIPLSCITIWDLFDGLKRAQFEKGLIDKNLDPNIQNTLGLNIICKMGVQLGTHGSASLWFPHIF